VGAVLIAIPTVVLSIALLAGCDWQVWVITAATNGVILLAYGFRTALLRILAWRDSKNKQHPANRIAIN